MTLLVPFVRKFGLLAAMICILGILGHQNTQKCGTHDRESHELKVEHASSPNYYHFESYSYSSTLTGTFVSETYSSGTHISSSIAPSRTRHYERHFSSDSAASMEQRFRSRFSRGARNLRATPSFRLEQPSHDPLTRWSRAQMQASPVIVWEFR